MKGFMTLEMSLAKCIVQLFMFNVQYSAVQFSLYLQLLVNSKMQKIPHKNIIPYIASK
jgi:hypothetical protein